MCNSVKLRLPWPISSGWGLKYKFTFIEFCSIHSSTEMLPEYLDKYIYMIFIIDGEGFGHSWRIVIVSNKSFVCLK